MPGTQRKLSLIAKSARLGENPSSSGSSTSMADNTLPTPGQLDADSLVERISAEVLKGVEASFDRKIDPVLKRLEVCANKIATLDSRVTEAEGRISSQEDATASYGARLSDVENKLAAALDKLDDLENRSRRCNIRLIGLPEGSEGTNPVTFFETWLPELLNVSFKGGSVKLDRCHRALTRRPPPDQRPQAVIIKFHNFQDKVRIMQAARKSHPLLHNGAQMLIFEDFSAAVIKKRQEFYQVKQRLKERGIPFAMTYPATLRIQHDGQVKFLKNPKEVVTFLDNLTHPPGSSSDPPAC